jgi:hypothetical protein
MQTNEYNAAVAHNAWQILNVLSTEKFMDWDDIRKAGVSLEHGAATRAIKYLYAGGHIKSRRSLRGNSMKEYSIIPMSERKAKSTVEVSNDSL